MDSLLALPPTVMAGRRIESGMTRGERRERGFEGGGLVLAGSRRMMAARPWRSPVMFRISGIDCRAAGIPLASPIGMAGEAAIAVALVDPMGQRTNSPVCEVLGGRVRIAVDETRVTKYRSVH